MSEFEEVYNPKAPKASAEFEAWWQKSGGPHLMKRTSGESFRYVYWICHTAYDAGKEAGLTEALEAMRETQIQAGKGGE